MDWEVSKEISMHQNFSGKRCSGPDNIDLAGGAGLWLDPSPTPLLCVPNIVPVLYALSVPLRFELGTTHFGPWLQWCGFSLVLFPSRMDLFVRHSGGGGAGGGGGGAGESES